MTEAASATATATAADAFARTVSSTGAAEVPRLLHALTECDLGAPDVVEWFDLAQRETLAARAVLLAARDLLRHWGIPAQIAVNVLPDLRRIAADVTSGIPAALVAAAAAGEDRRVAAVAAVAGVYGAALEPAERTFAAAGLGLTGL